MSKCPCNYNDMCVKSGKNCISGDPMCPRNTMSNQEYFAFEHARGKYCPFCNGQLVGFLTKKCKTCGEIVSW